MRPWLDARFVIGRPEVVEAQVVRRMGTRKWLLRTSDRQDFEMVFIPDADRGDFVHFPARSAARSTAHSVTPARCGWCAI